MVEMLGVMKIFNHYLTKLLFKINTKPKLLFGLKELPLMGLYKILIFRILISRNILIYKELISASYKDFSKI
jgi:hypothetical protein